MQGYWITITRLTIDQNGTLTTINSTKSPEAIQTYTATQKNKNP
jgi:hypothetical protein